MSSQKSKLNSENQNKHVGFKELQPLLRQILSDEELQVVDFTATRLLPPGENYCSIMVKLDIKFRRSVSAEEEMLHLVAKTPSWTGKPIVEWPLVFKKELFMYAELRPLYRQLERDAGVHETKLIDVWPEYVGYRNSLKDCNTIDQYSALLMKNVVVDGFYTCDRRNGLDVEHARRALESLARYHALGIAMKLKRPNFSEKAVDQARVMGIDFVQVDEGYDRVFRTFDKNPLFKKHFSIIASAFDRIKEGKTLKAEPSEPWATITHGDFWTNNILFHKDNEGNVDDVKFVDFQLYLYNSPLKDVPYFLCASLDKATQMNHLDELIVLYFNTFVMTLKRMDCNDSPYTIENFRLELKRQAINEFPLCALATKFFAFENDDDSKSNEELMNTIFDAEASNIYVDKLKILIEIYEKMEWF